ncbi:MAG TPA: hypothetical protein VIJ75_11430, partial [Hanamia sp.]
MIQNYKGTTKIKNSRDLSKAGVSFLLLWGSFPGTFPVNKVSRFQFSVLDRNQIQFLSIGSDGSHKSE